MSSMTDSFANALLDHVLRLTSYTAPSPWAGLFSTSPVDHSTCGTEVSGGGYVRLRVTTWDAPATGATENSSVLTWPQASASYNVTALGIFDASTTGCLLLYGGLTASKAVAQNDTFEVAASSLDITFD